MATEIGEIKVIIGKVGLITPDGTPQPLKVGAKVFTDQIITTGATGAVEIEFIDGSTMALPQNSQAVLDSETFDPLQPGQESDVTDLQDAIADVADLQDAIADVADLQDAIVAGADPTEEAEATAANAGSLPVGNEGASTEQVLHEQPTVTPESGFETTGPARGSVVLEAETLNDAFITVDDTATTNEDTPITITVLANDRIGSGGGSITSHTDPTNGSVVLNDDGTFTYTPSENYSGPDSFSYTFTANNGDTSTATVNVLIDDVPIMVDDTATTKQDTPTTITVLANDRIGKGGGSITSHTDPTNGSVVLNDDGTFTYTPSENYSGPDSFNYTFTDNNGDTSTATVNVLIDDVPITVDDTATTNEDTPITITVLANDRIGKGGGSITSHTDPTNGSVVLNDDGTFTYTPSENYPGPYSFSYTFTDNNGDTSTATVNVTVNDVPSTVDDTETTNEDTPITIAVLANDTIGNGGGSITGHTDPTNGSVVLNDDGTFTYTPSANYSGPDSFNYTFTATNSDTSTATVNVTVNAVADTPSLMLSLTSNQTNLIVNGSFENINGTDKDGKEITGLPDGNLTGQELVQRTSIVGWDLVSGNVEPMEPHAKAHLNVGTTDGEHFMDLGGTPGNSAIQQTVEGLIKDTKYKISFDYIDKAALLLAGKDSGVMEVYWNGELITTVYGDEHGAASWKTESFNVIGGSGDGTNTLAFKEIGTTIDNHGIALDNVEMHLVPYQYTLSLDAHLHDIDGNETLGQIKIVFPNGVYLASDPTQQVTETTIPSGQTTLSFTSDTKLTDDQINTITGSVTATESSNGDAATIDTTVKVLFDGTDALSETADLAIYGKSGADTIIGGAGDDTIIGGAGDDFLTGGEGADTFLWTKADVGAGSATRDTVVDFNPTQDKDILDLSDLLSDGSHTIDGLAVGDSSGGGQHFQLSIKNNGGVVVQTIDLDNMVISPGQDPSAMLNNLLNSGAINDGI